jgi:hypothetical protein
MMNWTGYVAGAIGVGVVYLIIGVLGYWAHPVLLFAVYALIAYQAHKLTKPSVPPHNKTGKNPLVKFIIGSSALLVFYFFTMGNSPHRWASLILIFMAIGVGYLMKFVVKKW